MFAAIVIAIVMLVRVRCEAYGPTIDEPVLFVEKRFGIGYTVNFGNVWSWVILGLVIVVPVALSFGRASSS